MHWYHETRRMKPLPSTKRLPFFRNFTWVLLVAPACLAAEAPQPDRKAAEFFETQVRPVLAQHCYECHADKKQKGDLRLDSRDAMLAGGATGPALVPGDPAHSLLITAVRHSDPDLTMPPKKKLSDAQIAALEQWVKGGAPWPGHAKAQATPGKFTEDDRRYWFFQPLSKPAVPQVKAKDLARNPVDAFVLRKLEAAGLSYSPQADKITLIRRATFDLHGLPPTQAEVDAFVADTSALAYENLIDRLLASPRYGERFGRLWLDVVRYSDSDGYKADDYRPHIWRYRDWVIDAFNADMPFDQFVTWQLAGDEAAPLDPGATIATGYLRLWPYEYNQRDVQRQWNDILDDVTANVGETFLGLSMHCARCHNHKFDPILQEDYFRLRAFFEPILPDDTITAATLKERAEHDRKHAAWDEKTRDLRAQIEAIEAPVRLAVEKPAISKFIVEMQRILSSPREQLSPGDQQIKDLAWRQLIVEHKNIAGKIKGEQKTQLDKLYAQLREFDSIKPAPLPLVTAVRDVGPVAPPTIIPGDKNGRVIAPGMLAILAGTPLAANREGEAPAEPRNTLDVGAVASTGSKGNGSAGASPSQSTGRRLALAQWLTRPDNALVTRVIANRIWQSHFGAGIVSTGNDFGRQGDKPTHPELLDFLAGEMVAGGWKIKAMHKLVMTSAAYRQGAEGAEGPRDQGTKGPRDQGTKGPRDQGTKGSDPQSAVRDPQSSANPKSEIRNPKSIDPSNHLLWRYPSRRLDAEQIRDAALIASGELIPQMYGPGVAESVARRSVYLKFMRNNRPELIETFDGPDGFNSVSRRNVTTIAPQALLMINGEWMAARAKKLAEESRRGAGGVRKNLIDQAHRRALGRPATEKEIEGAMAFIDSHAKKITGAQLAEQPAGNPDEKAGEKPTDKPRAGVFVDIARKPRMSMADKPALAFHEFTLEAVFSLRSIDQNANVRVIASQWDGSAEHPGWSIGVTGVKSKHQPQTLILQLVGKNEEGKPAYDVVVSGLKPQFNRAYHLVVTVRLQEIDSTGVTFHLRDLTGDMPPETASIGHTVVSGIDNANAFVIGGRDVPEKNAAAHSFDGILDDVRLYAEGLSPMQLVGGRSPKLESLIGDWRFEGDALGKDASGKRNDLTVQGVAEAMVTAKEVKPATATDATFAAFIDYCHVLLNSNEFLYVD